jgi:hypothetical protein
VWEYRQLNPASPSGFDDEGERILFTRHGDKVTGLYFGLEREGEHGLFYTLVELENIGITANKISFTIPARTLYSKRPAKLGEPPEQAGRTNSELTYEGTWEDERLVLLCNDTSLSCPDRRMVFRKDGWGKR